MQDHTTAQLDFNHFLVWNTGLQVGTHTVYNNSKHTNAHQYTHKPKDAKAHIGLIKCNPNSLTWKIAQWKSQIDREGSQINKPMHVGMQQMQHERMRGAVQRKEEIVREASTQKVTEENRKK